jgi:ABC-type Fe3+/spermidine/putrescine transport system ATPase subunit
MTGPGESPQRGAPVEVAALRKQYGAVVALAGADLSIRAGEFLSLLGASGSGKSTLLKLIAGLERASSGRILLDGVDATRLPPEKRGIGMVFQDYALFPTMSVRENIGFPLRMRGIGGGEAARRIERVARMVEVERLLDRRPSQLSGGQQQRVAIARAIVFDAPILLLDEPLSALDKNLREQTKGELKALHRRLGVTVIYVTHDQSEALAMSDRIAVLDHGEIVDVDTPEALYGRPRSRFIARFLGQANLLPVVVREAGAAGWIIDSPWGPLSLPPGRQDPLAVPGREALLVLRPEHVSVGAHAPADGRLRIAVTVEQALYHGAEVIYAARCARSGVELTLKATTAGRRLFAPGEAMPVAVELRHATLVAADSRG